MTITVSLLFYGDHPELADRCLRSLWERLPDARGHVRDLRLGYNAISPRTRQVTDWFVTQAAAQGWPLVTYDCPQNACKYPLMRRMLREDPVPPATWVMWFDDDSYLTGPPGWWQQLLAAAAEADMLGKLYTQGVVGQQWDWVSRQRWFNPQVGPPPVQRRHRGPAFRFATGGWWLIRSQLLAAYDWPTRELRHRGGDCLLGELCRHQHLRLINWEDGVRINADQAGRHSKSPRRGVDEHQLGHLAGRPLPDHDFACTRTAHGAPYVD